ncbi:hypothetical protein FSP39_015955 [Pinctada imbricata]|uniref:SWIM-type domain-containing protein n=1 Tax=Pinctada imbricata TaxID=66713 RepID=A0AA88Y0E8_PINIB|nr:hypothetical protein FSP39_015955 [Pinctada imbricata]
MLRFFNNVPFYFSYTIENIKAIQQYKQYSEEIPVFLFETTVFFKKHCMSRIQRCSDLTHRRLSDGSYQVKNVQSGGEYKVHLEKDLSSCTCTDWHIHHLPCKHILHIMIDKHYNWEDMPDNIKDNPLYIIDRDVVGLHQPIDATTPPDALY